LKNENKSLHCRINLYNQKIEKILKLLEKEFSCADIFLENINDKKGKSTVVFFHFILGLCHRY
jgi:hypothetical protein